MADDQSASSPGLLDYWQAFKVPIILGSISLLCIVLSITLFIKSHQDSKPIEFHTAENAIASISAEESMLTVDVAGSVVNPGVYKLPQGSRIEDALRAAGGLASDAHDEFVAKSINRAAKLVDGAKIFIPRTGEQVSGGDQVVAGTLSSALFSVNSASQSELETLPGVGPVTAKKIIDNRPYQTLEELVIKKALSQSLFTKLKDQLSL